MIKGCEPCNTWLFNQAAGQKTRTHTALPTIQARLALKVVPCDHLDDREAANAAAATLAEAV